MGGGGGDDYAGDMSTVVNGNPIEQHIPLVLLYYTPCAMRFKFVLNQTILSLIESISNA